MAPRLRADLLLVARGLVESRAKAQAAIGAGCVAANGVSVDRASALIDAEAVLEIRAPHPWVSRGGVKLAHALDAFGISASDKICLDVGASTGGFTHVLCERGASRVYAVDVGRDQLHESLRADPRIVSLERTDARELTSVLVPERPSLVVCDASFIGAAKVLAAPLALAEAAADLVVLIKPQFEAGPGRGGVLREEVARAVAEAALRGLDGLEGFRLRGAVDSPIRGGEGNLEWLAHLQRR